jgi:RimJ/RimL family protein N-acetyltransferase
MLIQLRDLTEADLEALYQFQDDPVANQMADFPARDRDSFFEHWRTNVLGREDVFAQGIIADDVLVGSVLLWSMNAASAHPDWFLGYWLGREFWGKGIASQAVSIFVKSHSKRPIIAEVASENKGSIRILEKLGFEHCGAVEESEYFSQNSQNPLLEMKLSN